MDVPKMRSLEDALAEVKRQDKDTSLTMYTLRLLVKQGKIPSVVCGRKIMISLDNLIKYLSSGY